MQTYMVTESQHYTVYPNLPADMIAGSLADLWKLEPFDDVTTTLDELQAAAVAGNLKEAQEIGARIGVSIIGNTQNPAQKAAEILNKQSVLDYLGDTPATEEQINQLQRLANDLEETYPTTDPDTAEDYRAAFNAGARVILGDSTAEEIVSNWKTTRALAKTLAVEMRGALAVELQTKPESTVAKEHGIARNTVRTALGK